jgi:hypothetical protein
MARTPIRAGELGAVQITRLARGRYRARARTRDDAGTLHQIVAVAATEESARLALKRKAELLSSSLLAGSPRTAPISMLMRILMQSVLVSPVRLTTCVASERARRLDCLLTRRA